MRPMHGENWFRGSTSYRLPTYAQGGESEVRSEEINTPHLRNSGGEQVGKITETTLHTPPPYGVWGVVRKGSAKNVGGEEVGNGWGFKAWQGCRQRLRELLSELNEPQPQRTT